MSLPLVHVAVHSPKPQSKSYCVCVKSHCSQLQETSLGGTRRLTRTVCGHSANWVGIFLVLLKLKTLAAGALNTSQYLLRLLEMKLLW